MIGTRSTAYPVLQIDAAQQGLPLFIREHLDYAQNFVKNFNKMKWHSETG